MIYKNYGKRIFDLVTVLLAILLLWWLFLIVALMVRMRLGAPVLFKQVRPGKGEKLFTIYKFRTMTDLRDDKGQFLPDAERLTDFGKFLRSTSCDELPELINIFKGDMSVVGPRPQLVKDMVFMTKEQRVRHSVMPGLTGLAQVSGRNAVSWEEKLSLDLQYVNSISFWGDACIVFRTVFSVFSRIGITEEGEATATDFGDYLLANHKISRVSYLEKQEIAKSILLKFES